MAATSALSSPDHSGIPIAAVINTPNMAPPAKKPMTQSPEFDFIVDKTFLRSEHHTKNEEHERTTHVDHELHGTDKIGTRQEE